MIVRDRNGCERVGARSVALAEKFDLPMIPLVGPVPYGLGEGTRAYLVGGSRFDGRGVSFHSERAPFISSLVPPWLRRGSTRAV